MVFQPDVVPTAGLQSGESKVRQSTVAAMPYTAPSLPTPRSAGLAAGHKERPSTVPKVTGSRAPMRNSGMMAAIASVEEDDAKRRVLKTPKVFQSSSQHFAFRKQCELRSNLLPSIVWTPLDGTHGSGSAGDGAGTIRHTRSSPSEVEPMGDFHQQYQEELQRRAKCEEEVAVFLGRDQSFPSAERDPLQIIAKSCSVLGDLVNDKLMKFRRAQDRLVDTSSKLPFMNEDQSMDLSELSNVLTLDLERRDYPFKDSVKRPGFLSLQLTSRVPLWVHDPAAGVSAGKIESEQIRKDLHMIRLDLKPGEVRQVAYGLDNADFRETELAKRMSAVIDPERSVIADLVRTLRAKENEGQALNRVLSDILRDLPEELPPAAEPDLECVGEEASTARLNDLMKGPRKTLGHMLEVSQILAQLASPLVPSLAHALDRIALMCVREVDRLAVRCHRDYEQIFSLWSNSEKERRSLAEVIDRMGGKADGSGGIELKNRVGKLHSELMQQEQLYSDLLVEYRDHVTAAEESHRTIAGLRKHCQASQAEINVLHRQLEEARKDREPFDDAGSSSPRNVRSSARRLDKLPSDLDSRHPQLEDESLVLLQRDDGSPKSAALSAGSPKAGQRPPASQLPLDREGIKKLADQLLAFTVSTSTQTPTNHFFNDNADLAEELGLGEFEDIAQVARRVYGVLAKYEWNTVASKFFLTASGNDEDSDDEALKLNKQDSAQIDSRLGKMLALRSLKTKVERSHVTGKICELEEENYRLQASAKVGFDKWLTESLTELGSTKVQSKQGVVSPEVLWEEMTKLVHNDGMRVRIRELEDHLSQLLPLSTRVRGGDGTDDGDGAFWKRVIRQVRSTNRTAQNQKEKAAPKWGARNRRLSSNAAMPRMDDGRLLGELASIWASVLSHHGNTEAARIMTAKVQSAQVLQSAIKMFYLRKSGRARHVESSVVGLCKSVCDQLLNNPKITLFAIMTDIYSPESMEGKLPVPQRSVEMNLNAKALRDLPLDAAHVMSTFIHELKLARCSNKYPGVSPLEEMGDGQDADDYMLPLQLVNDAARTCISSRAQATAKYFNLLMLAFAEFSPRLHSTRVLAQLFNEPQEERLSERLSENPDSPESPHATGTISPHTNDSRRGSDVNSSDSPACGSRRASTTQLGGPVPELDRDALHLMVYVSHLINVYVWQRINANAAVGIITVAQTDWDKEEEVLNVLWLRLLENAASVSEIRRNLGLSSESACLPKKVSECLVKWSVVALPVDIVSRAVTFACKIQSNTLGDTPGGDVRLDKETFTHFCHAHHFCGEDGGIRCRESIALWAGTWALCNERLHEIKKMGILFELYDTSHDGWLQFEEFADFIREVAPNINNEEAEELFLCGVEEVQGDMTKDVFLALVTRLGISSDIDRLDDLCLSKRPVLSFDEVRGAMAVVKPSPIFLAGQ